MTRSYDYSWGKCSTSAHLYQLLYKALTKGLIHRCSGCQIAAATQVRCSRLAAEFKPQSTGDCPAEPRFWYTGSQRDGYKSSESHFSLASRLGVRASTMPQRHIGHFICYQTVYPVRPEWSRFSVMLRNSSRRVIIAIS